MKGIMAEQANVATVAVVKGVALGGGTFVAAKEVATTFDIAQATAFAGLCAGSMTTCYFFLMSILTLIKIYKAAKRGEVE